jgi:hypothetical protein
MEKRKKNRYEGFEQGAIRPPSEAASLLFRLTRNCPWNQCTFCRVYKRRDFSIRPLDDIIKDIDLIHTYVDGLRRVVKPGTVPGQEEIARLYSSFETKDRVAFNIAMNWYTAGMESIFLQDANSLIMKPDDLVFVLEHIQNCFPETLRITSYARSHTIVRIKETDLARMAKAGLNRLHVGMETGSDKVLKLIRKGATKQTHIKAGLKVKGAGIELSEYVMPGLGGIDLSIEHALETASALNSINPDFIRLRTLAVTDGTPLAYDCERGLFEKPSDIMMAKEVRLFIESLDGIESRVKSDHILNLFETINGTLPRDKEKLIGIIDSFFELPQEERVLYQVGRRMGLFRGPDEMAESVHLDQVKQACKHYGVTPENVDTIIDELMKRFV